MCENPWDFCRKLKELIKKHYKNKKNILITALIITGGCFFYSDASGFLASENKSGNFSSKDNELISKINENLSFEDDGELSFFEAEKINPELIAQNNFAQEIREITSDYPIEEMAPYIAKYDEKVAALIVGIAKKESDWGKHSPSKNGQTCYNYWGYKGYGSNGLALGYGCFGTPEEAVNAIGGRIEELVNKKIDTPQKMVVWKCGSSCAGHDPQGVNKWISDVAIYYNKITGIHS